MASAINTTEYMYCSARIRALEASLISSEKMRVISDCPSEIEAQNKLAEYGIELIRSEDGDVDTEATLQKIYTDAVDQVSKNTPHPENLDFLRYPYDCNNLKAAIKCYFRGIDPESMFYDCGTVAAANAKRAVAGEPTSYPKNLSDAVSEAMDSYSKTKNPQNIDLILDCACYKDMLACAEKSECELFVRLVKTKIDLTNIITCIRLLRMKMGIVGQRLLVSALIEGGSYGEKFFLEAYDGGESRLCEMLAFSVYDKFIACVCENPDSLSRVEKFSDDIYMEIAKGAKMLPFGPEVAAGYLVAVEYQVKNLRIILDAKKTGKSGEIVSERLRCSYV